MKTTWAVLLVLLLAGAAQADVAVPPLTQRVTDLTATLDAQQAGALEARLAAFEAKKGAQLAVLIIPTTQPETIEQFGMRAVEAWQLGRKGVDDGALLLVAKDDRALRIEVGYGLEGALNDATAKRIIAEIITPFFKRGEFYAGIDAGTAAMMRIIDGEPLPPQRAAASGTYNIESLLFIAFGLVVVVGGMLRALLGRFPAAMLMGGGLSVLAWLTVAPVLVALLVGLMAFVFVLLGGAGHGIGGHGRGGFGGFSGGGGGGFSGGGGGFGGGGASGRW
ncbi:MAG: TPM domain-containing protein [Sideroxyarcus sp.]|nr:TPM domain-containing protein [Sideroxyarcus sp.]